MSGLELDMEGIVIALHDIKAKKLDVGVAAIHVESTEPNSLTQFKVADLHRRTGFRRYGKSRAEG